MLAIMKLCPPVLTSSALQTFQVATPDQAEEVHLHIREWFTERIGEKDAEALRIIYGMHSQCLSIHIE